MTFRIVTDSPRGNLAVNRAACSLFIERSLAGITHPCYRCPQRRVLQDPDRWGYFNTCPCGMEYFDPYDPDMDNLHFSFDQPHAQR